MLATSVRLLLFKFWDFYQVFPGGGRWWCRNASEHVRLLHIALNALLWSSVLLKLPLLTLGEYKFGINWFSAKMWSVKPRKIKTPGGELCHVQLTLYLTLVTLFTLYLILVTLFTLYLTQVTLCAQSQFWWYVTTTPHLLLLLQCTSSILHHLSPRCELKFLFVSTTDICWGQNWRYVFVFVFVFVFEVLL